jgi:predicted small lipoprotein YifL
MKPLLSLFVAALALSLTACGGGQEPLNAPVHDSSQTKMDGVAATVVLPTSAPSTPVVSIGG